MKTADILAVIPHYNHETTVAEVAAAMAAQGFDVLVVDDGSSPAARAVAEKLPQTVARTRVLLRRENGGKGAAVTDGLRYAAAQGYSHVLQIDADGQHCFADAQKLAAAAFRQPEALICGNPVYGADAPRHRRYGRKITNFWIGVNTGSRIGGDGMCGLRIYPLAAVGRLLHSGQKLGRRMDFDTEILVRLYWQRVPLVWIDTPVRYAADGVSHFRQLADNWQISKMHARLFGEMLLRRARRQFPFGEKP